MGTKDMDFVQLNQLIGRKTGGISIYPLTSSVRGKVDPCTRIIIRGKAMSGKVEDLFNLVCLLCVNTHICKTLFVDIHKLSFFFLMWLSNIFVNFFSGHNLVTIL